MELPKGPIGTGGGSRRRQDDGDLRLLEGDQFLNLPGQPSYVKVELDAEAIEAAVRLFQLSSPVKIKWSRSGLGSNKHWGTHWFRGGMHLIHVSTYWPADEVSRTLWHELVHARQQEQYESDREFDHAYRREQRSVGYKRNCFEVEANEVAEIQHKTRPLARKEGEHDGS